MEDSEKSRNSKPSKKDNEESDTLENWSIRGRRKFP